MKKAAASLLMVFIASLFGVFIVMAWQSRLLLSLQRSKALSDILVLTYDAESKIYDLFAKFVGNYPAAFTFPFSHSEVLADGTQMNTTGIEDGDLQTLEVTAKRTMATSKLQITKKVNKKEDKVVKDTNIVFSLDCTGSMVDKACSTCSTSRMDELKKAVLAFLDSVKNDPNSDKIKVGLSVFELTSAWMNTSYANDGTPIGVDITPDSGLTIDQMKDAVNLNLGHGGDTSSRACKKLLTYTSVGSGLVFMHDYFDTVHGDKKKFEVLVTDGIPNQRIPFDGCPVSIFCPGTSSYCGHVNGWTCPRGSGETTCTPYARDFLRCAMAATDQTWEPEKTSGPLPGIKDPGVKTFVATVLDTPPADVTDIFNNYATKYYNSASAADLTGILQDIFNDITSITTDYKINKIIPTPE